jgi:hypothetical protein
MSLMKFIDNNQVLSGALLGSVSTLIGVVVTQISGILAKKIEIDAQIRYRKFDWSWEFEKRCIIDPALTFLDSELRLMTFVYTQGFEDKEADEEIKKHILDMPTISARIKALDDHELSGKFNEFTRKRLAVGNNVLDEYKKDMNAAFTELQEAEKLAGEIILSIKMRIREQDKLVMKPKYLR